MKCISYAIFAPSKDNWADLDTYLRGLAINIRLNRLLYPLWTTVLHLDKSTYEAFENLIIGYTKAGRFEFRICDEAPMTKAMLWRLKPIFEKDNRGNHKWEAVICRDLDSPTTYREAQAVQYWLNNGRVAHAITDSVSHNMPMMGGMIGFIPKYFNEYMHATIWDELFIGCRMDFSIKGMDQELLSNEIYPFFSQYGKDSITQHYFKGMPNTYLSDQQSCRCGESGHKKGCPLDIPLPGVNESLRSTNDLCGHIGAAGAYMPVWDYFERKHHNDFEDLNKIEKEYSHIFYWAQ